MPAITAEHAVAVINSMIYKPGWTFEPEVSDRFENTVQVRITYPARNYNRDQAPEYPQEINPSAVFMLPVSPCDCDESLIFEVIKLIMRIEDHEAREALRVPTPAGDFHAPFHPHNYATMCAWSARSGNPIARDLMFGAI
jgi:hypothetical protein